MSHGADNARWFRPAGSLADSTGAAEVQIDGGIEGWEHTGLVVVAVGGSTAHQHRLDGSEAVIVPLSGAVTVEVDAEPFELRGRTGVFAGATDVLYAPPGSTLTLTAPGPGPSRVALCLARVPEDGPDGLGLPGGQAQSGGPARSVLSARLLAAEEVPVELRGAGTASRQVRNFAVPGVLDASRIIACEVITPAGNWSSWPPHKHDEERPGVETELEEIYYFETQSTSSRGTDPVGYQRVYGTQDRPIDVLAEVRTGDVVLVPHGWHGPAMAAPDADLYYLNVMAGPGAERAWLICDDPAHGWVREEWESQEIDPRLSP